ncbi:MAG: hypothetical protein WCA81_02580 [Rhizomicrobium sp.]
MGTRLHKEEDAGSARDPPCTKAEDIYSRQAKRTIGRLLSDFLTQNKLTPTELLHRSDMLKKLEATGTLLQYAVQQTAIARAAAEKIPVQEIIKVLNDVVSDVYDRAFQDKRDNVFPEVKAEKFAALASKLAARDNGLYVLNGAIAKHLRDARSWDEKVVRLIRLMDTTQPESPGGELLAGAGDTIIAEILHTGAAVQDIIGPRENFGEAVIALINLFLGAEQAGQYGKEQGLALLARYFFAGKLPLSRHSVGERIIAEILSLKRLRTDSYDNELKMLRRIVALATPGIGDMLPGEDLTAALELRSKRFVAPECLNECLSNTVLPDEKLDWLFFADECIVGEQNKQVLADAAIRIVTSTEFKEPFRSPRIAMSKRLQRLAFLNARARHCGFHESPKREIADILDAIAWVVALHANLFEIMDAKSESSAEKVMTILQLFAAGTFTEGRLSAKARDAVMGYLSQPGFLTGYIDMRSKAGYSALDTEAATAELVERLQKIGIPGETSLNALAACASCPII